MASEFDKLVDAVTELVLSELAAHRPSASAPTGAGGPGAGGSPVLVAPGPGKVEDGLWASLSDAAALSPSALVWNGFGRDRLPEGAAGFRLETRTTNWAEVVSAYKAVVLLGSDLGVLGGLAQLGAGGGPPAGVAVAALAAGLPVFIDNAPFEALRRHSSRLASGFVARFEECYRSVSSFGVEFGGGAELASFLQQFSRPGPAAPLGAGGRSSGRDVITVEDVEAVRRAGAKRLNVAIGSIVTPLAAQRASEWGIEVVLR